jgi:hypothetical protein
MSSDKQTWRLFVAPQDFLTSNVEVLLPEEEHHYAFHVLRLGLGESRTGQWQR